MPRAWDVSPRIVESKIPSPLLRQALGGAASSRALIRIGKLTDRGLFRDAVFFVLRTEDAVDGVGGAVAGFVVVADLHLAEQADGEQVQSRRAGKPMAAIISGP